MDISSRTRIVLEYAHSVDPDRWMALHADGIVPDRLPYGLDRIAEYGFCIDARRPAHSSLLRLAAGGVRRATGGLDFVNAGKNPARRTADVALCWDERTGVPAALRSLLPGEPPTAFGALWLTEPSGGLPPWGRMLARRALHAAVAVWGNSEPQLDILQRAWGVGQDRLSLVHMGIDTDFWRPDPQVDRDPCLVVGAGNDRHRDHPLLVEAMKQVQVRRPDVRFELATAQPVALTPGLGVVHRSLTHPQMRDLYNRAAVVVVATRPNFHMSGLSVLLEAMSVGKPVVGTRTPGMEEYIASGVSGFLESPGDPKGFADRVVALLDDEPLRRSIGHAAQRAIEDRLTTARLASDLASVVRAAVP